MDRNSTKEAFALKVEMTEAGWRSSSQEAEVFPVPTATMMKMTKFCSWRRAGSLDQAHVHPWTSSVLSAGRMVLCTQELRNCHLLPAAVETELVQVLLAATHPQHSSCNGISIIQD